MDDLPMRGPSPPMHLLRVRRNPTTLPILQPTPYEYARQLQRHASKGRPLIIRDCIRASLELGHSPNVDSRVGR